MRSECPVCGGRDLSTLSDEVFCPDCGYHLQWVPDEEDEYE